MKHHEEGPSHHHGSPGPADSRRHEHFGDGEFEHRDFRSRGEGREGHHSFRHHRSHGRHSRAIIEAMSMAASVMGIFMGVHGFEHRG